MSNTPTRTSRWLVPALATTVTWGLWGAWSDLPAQHGFPETLTYVVWSLTMILPAAWMLRAEGLPRSLSWRSALLGLATGLTGAAGVLALFPALSAGPAWLVFPIVSLSPVVTIALSSALLGERTGRAGLVGIALAVASLPLLNDWSPQAGTAGLGAWFPLSLLVMVLWGVQGWFIRLAHRSMGTGTIFGFMTLGGLLLVPVALVQTDWSAHIFWGLQGPVLSAGVQFLNAVGSLALVFALREGKAIVVSPLTNAGSTAITALISVAITSASPGPYKLAGIVLAILSAALLAVAD